MYTLSEQQQNVLTKFDKGENMFLTGSAGTGKSFLIHKMYTSTVALSYKEIQICAMTGIASVLLNNFSRVTCKAKTIHSWSGIQLCNTDRESIIRRVLKKKRVCNEWKKIHILIIDEVSMMSCYMFDILEELARTIRKNARPFGGIQVIFTGDMFQLPPIGDGGIPESYPFCFESSRWLGVFPETNHIELTHIYRQNDPVYINLLNRVRLGEITEEDKAVLKARIGLDNTGVVLTKLFPIRINVDRINQYEFNKIQEPEFHFPLKGSTGLKTWLESGEPFSKDVVAVCQQASMTDLEQEVQILKSQLPYCVENLVLKKGAVVMCVANLDIERGICNGSQGRILNILVDQIRMANVNGLIQPVKMDIPVVEFNNGVIYDGFEVKYWQSQNIPSVAIGQVPLILSWASSIHKSQGMTLSHAEMDLGNQVFEYGQAYVALSRVKSLDGLYLTHFNPTKIKANPRVVEFYKQIKNWNECIPRDTDTKKLETETTDLAIPSTENSDVKKITVFSRYNLSV